MSKKNYNDTVWIYGKHAVKAALQNPSRDILRLIVLKSNEDFLKECKISIKPEIVDKNFFVSVLGSSVLHQGYAILTKKLRDYSLEELMLDKSDTRPFVFLDQVNDPQNIGSILRASAVFGARAVVVTENNSPELTSTIIKAASGAVELIPLVHVVNLVHTINDLKKHGFWCIGLDERSDKRIYEIPLNDKFIFVIGSEGAGMRKLTRETCDFLVQLPYDGNFSTLNAAQAATVSLYEMLRQKRRK